MGVSKDSVRSHQNFKEKYELPFLLLSDPAAEVCNAFGVIQDKKMYGKVFPGIQRSTFVIGEDGTIIKVYPKVSPEGHAKEVLADL